MAESTPCTDVSNPVKRPRRHGWWAVAATVYFGLVLWLMVGSAWSERGQWPHWGKDVGSGLNYRPKQGWDDLIILSFWCFPVPLVLFFAALAWVWAGLRTAPRRPIARCCLLPLLIVAVAWVVYLCQPS
jgi:hypothetical protein